MQDIQESLSKLPKVSPSSKFVALSKKRLMNQIGIQQNEAWFFAFLRKLGVVTPSKIFVSQARARLMESIKRVRQPLWSRLLCFHNKLLFIRRLAASTMVMIIAVTATLFYVEGGQIVSAVDDTYIEVINGDVQIKRADNLIWDSVSDQIELSAGDLIRLSDGAKAVVRFFDDSQMRLTDSSLVLISKLDVSPAYSRQGIIEVSLHEGNAWVQTLNVSDGHAEFSVITRDAIAKAVNAAFGVESHLQKPTTLRAYRNKIEVDILQSDTRAVISSTKIGANQQLQITPTLNNLSKPSVVTQELTKQDLSEPWIQANLQRDHDHLVELQESELNRLKLATGSLPGEFFYPIKQAKERLKLALSFGEDTDTQIEIANKRLNEAIVLLQEGDKQKASELLMTYQSIVRSIAESSQEETSEQVGMANLLVIPHKKSLIASLPSDVPINMVKEALNETEELFAENSIDKEQVRLENSIERLTDIAVLIEIGNIEGAKEALVNHELASNIELADADNIEDQEAKKEAFSNIMELQTEELDMLKVLVAKMSSNGEIDSQFVSMMESAQNKAESEVERVVAYVKPIMPEIIQSEKEIMATKSNVQMIVEKVNIYKTWQGQKNQLARLLKREGAFANNIGFMTELRNNLEGRPRDYINTRILELERIAAENKSKAIERKIDRAIRSRVSEQGT